MSGTQLPTRAPRPPRRPAFPSRAAAGFARTGPPPARCRPYRPPTACVPASRPRRTWGGIGRSRHDHGRSPPGLGAREGVRPAVIVSPTDRRCSVPSRSSRPHGVAVDDGFVERRGISVGLNIQGEHAPERVWEPAQGRRKLPGILVVTASASTLRAIVNMDPRPATHSPHPPHPPRNATLLLDDPPSSSNRIGPTSRRAVNRGPPAPGSS